MTRSFYLAVDVVSQPAGAALVQALGLFLNDIHTAAQQLKNALCHDCHMIPTIRIDCIDCVGNSCGGRNALYMVFRHSPDATYA